MKSILKFISRITVIHIFTYILSSIIFTIVFDYSQLYRTGVTAYYMKEYGSVSIIAGPLIQLFRGTLYGMVLLITRNSFIDKKNGCLKLWIVMLILGLINPLTISPGSIMGIIYTQIPFEFHIKTAIEVTVQSLIFAIMVTKLSRFESKVMVAPKVLLSLTILSATCFLISISALLLSLTKYITIGAEDLLVYAIIFFGYLFIMQKAKRKMILKVK